MLLSGIVVGERENYYVYTFLKISQYTHNIDQGHHFPTISTKTSYDRLEVVDGDDGHRSRVELFCDSLWEGRGSTTSQLIIILIRPS